MLYEISCLWCWPLTDHSFPKEELCLYAVEVALIPSLPTSLQNLAPSFVTLFSEILFESCHEILILNAVNFRNKIKLAQE